MRARIATIVRKELTSAIRSRMLWGTVVALILMGTSSTLNMYVGPASPASLGVVAENIPLHLYRFLPVVGLLTGYKAVVGERESGSIRFLLGLPTTHHEVLIGKFLGRSAVLTVVVVTTITILVAESIALYGGVAAFELFVHAILLLIYGLVWTGIAVGISAMVMSRFRAVAIVFGLYAVTHFFWQHHVLPIAAYLFTGTVSTSGLRPIATAQGPTWYLYVQRLNPVRSYQYSRALLSELLRSKSTTQVWVYLVDSPEYMFGFGMLFLWLVVPLFVGYLRFRSVEIR
ncbi:ABC transporter permease subunit [Halorussus sp. MSC15.2]|uniref:ABC transporter permease subunit n=1 Tax=Halorussus sp. MSC15.2 TaxID=2283638 RepID=UPI0013D1AC57|nr:ABC transporter permease subunit [Halorussus sp. MSC15.2]NEU57582.1 ABC transporter permease subunit [Halorussus sp. MSC15.2]